MASVISSEVISDRPQRDGRRYIRYKFVLEDNNSQQRTTLHNRGLMPSDFDTAADMLIVGPQMLVQQAEQEIQQFQDDCRDGNDPLHDWIGYWTKSTPDWNSWDDAANGTLKHFLALEDQLELVYIDDTMGKISNSDVVSVLGVTNQNQTDIRADIQVAVNTKTSLDEYGVWFDDGGNLVQ